MRAGKRATVSSTAQNKSIFQLFNLLSGPNRAGQRSQYERPKDHETLFLNPTHAMRGWMMLPYGVQHTHGTTSEFMDKHDYALLLDCDGQTDIPYDTLRWRQ